MPYAEVDTRFGAPSSPPRGEQTRDATTFGPACAQLTLDGDAIGQEDCLTVNVWSPGGEDKPTLVFLHGGGNVTGSSRQAVYGGQRFAAAEDIVVVSGNYRLGPLGYFEHPRVSTPALFGGANQALQDQLVLLDWVVENIAAFGGDPGNVTVVGQSAGGRAVCALLRLTGRKPSLHKAAIFSATCEFEPLAKAQQFAQAVADATHCQTAECLQGLSVDVLLEALPSWPTMVASSRHNIAAESPGAAAVLQPVPLLVGSNADEVYASIPELPTVEAYVQLWASQMGAAAASDAQVRYLEGASDLRRAVSDAYTDARYTCTAQRTAAAAAGAGPSPLRYRFLLDRPLDNAGQKALGSYHGLELLYLFGNFEEVGYAPSEADKRFSADFMHALAGFARTGRPAGRGFEWTGFSPGTSDLQPVAVLDEAPHIETDPRGEHCGFWLGSGASSAMP